MDGIDDGLNPIWHDPEPEGVVLYQPPCDEDWTCQECGEVCGLPPGGQAEIRDGVLRCLECASRQP